MVSTGQLSPATRIDLMPPAGRPSRATPPADADLACRSADLDTLALRDLAGAAGWRRPVLLDADLLVLVTGGHGTAELDFRPLPCRPGTLLRVRPGQVLRCDTRQLDAVVVRWRAGALRDLGVDADGLPAYQQLAGEDEDAVINEVTQLVVDCRRHPDAPAARALLRHQLAVLLLRLALLPDPTEGSGAGRRAGSDIFGRLCQEVERGYRHTRRVEDYAARLGCSVRTLTRACLAANGRSAKQVIDERVALEARRLLAATDEPIAQIGRRLGFPEPTNFGRFFSREVGMSPGAFRAPGAGAGPGAGSSAWTVRPRRPADPPGRPRQAE
ncbi:helix-turn-helix transcriptional regulator [Micromonospora sp. NPDC048830]|uniref:helix-turn-helix transcriptional regulator n=1 Tax=Micromonospora sp. NPDC048830 TaxID=3364257 RepID=UPI003716B6F4